MNLYDLSEQMQDALADLTARFEAGEIDADVLTDTMEGIQGHWDDKALAVAKYTLGLDAEAEAVKAAAKRMADRAKSLESRAGWLRGYLLGQVVAVGRCPKDAEISIALRKSKAVSVDDPAAIPLTYKRHVPEAWEPDKAAIKAAIEAGQDVAGAHVETRQNLVIK